MLQVCYDHVLHACPVLLMVTRTAHDRQHCLLLLLALANLDSHPIRHAPDTIVWISLGNAYWGWLKRLLLFIIMLSWFLGTHQRDIPLVVVVAAVVVIFLLEPQDSMSI